VDDEEGHKEQPAVDAHPSEDGFSFVYLQGLLGLIVVLMGLMWLARRGNNKNIMKEKVLP